ncbi:MAG: DUF692 domain-containing protein [Rhodospirillaceae bacterium]
MNLARACGIGLRSAHLAEIASEPKDAPLTAPWLEIHTENFLSDGGPRLATLDAIAARYPISCHSVALSLGSAQGLDKAHLARVSTLVARVKPRFISDHLSWSAVDGVHYNDLLPLPYDEGTLDIVARNISEAQDAFDRRILIENPSRYLAFSQSTMDEPEFLRRLAARTGCGLLLDINNVHVSATNLGFDAADYLARIPAQMVEEIHLAGFASSAEQPVLLVDTHSHPVAEDVWVLYEQTIGRIGPRPTLIEWDSNVPSLAVLLAETERAQKVLSR